MADAPPCLFCRRRPARTLDALSGRGAAADLGRVVAFCSTRCAARAAIACVDSHPKTRELIDTVLMGRETRRTIGLPASCFYFEET